MWRVPFFLFCSWAVLGTTLYAFVHAAMQRTDAYTAAEKLTKPVWLVILGVAGLLSLVLGITGDGHRGGRRGRLHRRRPAETA